MAVSFEAAYYSPRVHTYGGQEVRAAHGFGVSLIAFLHAYLSFALSFFRISECFAFRLASFKYCHCRSWNGSQTTCSCSHARVYFDGRRFVRGRLEVRGAPGFVLQPPAMGSIERHCDWCWRWDSLYIPDCSCGKAHALCGACVGRSCRGLGPPWRPDAIARAKAQIKKELRPIVYLPDIVAQHIAEYLECNWAP